MNWKFEILNEKVEAEINALPLDIRAKLTWIKELISELGPKAVKEPYVKHL